MAEDRRDYGILISLYMREEAEVMASALRAEGIDAFVGNRHHANVDWGWTIALGGMQVFVPRAKLQEAKDVIRARLKEAAEAPDPEAEPTRRRDRWKVWAVIAVSLFLPIGGLTAHTLDGHLNDVAFQHSLRDGPFGLQDPASDFWRDADMAFCEEGADRSVFVFENGVQRETPCEVFLRQSWQGR